MTRPKPMTREEVKRARLERLTPEVDSMVSLLNAMLVEGRSSQGIKSLPDPVVREEVKRLFSDWLVEFSESQRGGASVSIKLRHSGYYDDWGEK